MVCPTSPTSMVHNHLSPLLHHQWQCWVILGFQRLPLKTSFLGSNRFITMFMNCLRDRKVWGIFPLTEESNPCFSGHGHCCCLQHWHGPGEFSLREQSCDGDMITYVRVILSPTSSQETPLHRSHSVVRGGTPGYIKHSQWPVVSISYSCGNPYNFVVLVLISSTNCSCNGNKCIGHIDLLYLTS